MNNQDKDQIIVTRRGKYEYDADFDCYRRMSDPVDEKTQRKTTFIALAILLAMTIAYLLIGNP